LARKRTNDAAGFWERPELMNLIADLLMLAALLALAYAALVALTRLPLFPLREVVVAGSLREVTRTQLEYAARSAVRGNFFTVNLDAVRAACEKLPWVRRAAVRRTWPAGITVRIEEHVAVARWRQADHAEARLVNAEGEVFAASSDADLPLFSGPEGTAPQIAERHRQLADWLAPLGRQPRAVALSPRQAWQVRMDDGVLLDIGRDQARSGVQERVLRYVAVQREASEKLRGPVEGIDLRYPNGFAVRPARAALK